MTSGIRNILGLGVACMMLLPVPVMAYSCIPPYYHTAAGWLEKWYPSYPYALEQDRTLRIYSASSSITTGVLKTESDAAYARWNNAAGYCLPSFTDAVQTSAPPTNQTSVVIFATHQAYVSAGGDPNGDATTKIAAVSGSGNVLNARILIDGSLPWAPTCAGGSCQPTQFSLLGTLVHEWGHLLCLDHPQNAGAPYQACIDVSVMEAAGNMLGSSWQETPLGADGLSIVHLYQGFAVDAGLSFDVHAGPSADTLLWSETIPRSCRYNLYVSDSCWGPFTYIGYENGVTVYDHYSFVASASYQRNYWYRLEVEQEGATVDSAQAHSTRTQGTSPSIPGVPAGVTADGARTDGNVALSWQAASGTVEGYYVYRGVSSMAVCEAREKTFGPITGTAMIDSTAEAGVPLVYRVRAFNSTGGSDVSDQATAEVPVDTLPPAAVQDLTVSGANLYSAKLNWTAPGDDSLIGRGREYDLRYSTSTITSVNVNGATRVEGLDSPDTTGSTQCWVVGDLAANVNYYFALRTKDEAGNWSPLSNVAEAFTGTTGMIACGGGEGGEGGRSVPIAQAAALPSRLELAVLNPNLSPEKAAIRFGVPASATGSRYDLAVFDVIGRRLATLASGNAAAGWSSVQLPRFGMRSGVYFVRLRLGNSALTRTLVIAR